MIKKFYLRDDDAGAANARFMKTFRLLKAEGMAASYAVIPAELKENLVGFLKAEARAGTVFEVLQHGWTHKNRGSRWLRQEFGNLAPAAAQKQDILKGFKLLKKNFGKLFTPVFVPPFHVYNIDTLRAAKAAGLKGFSASKRIPAGGRGLFFITANIDVNVYAPDGRPMPLNLERLKQKTINRLKSRGDICAYFHHDTFDAANFAVFKAYLSFLEALRARGLIEFSLFKEAITQIKDKLH
ncbi:MAG: polysaccharide deacetylase family protein [Elusimicrobia bacterium]|nr:polysaccharide deacetylase family protein [Elusimicrobiota bacterium]